jgi:hypothetical protein
MTNNQALVTICIPIGPGHEDVARRAMDSVKAQTVPVDGLAFHDRDGRGAGYARNQLLSKVATPYVAFLDADDWLEPQYAERMLAALRETEVDGAYVYSDWYETTPAGNVVRTAPERCYCFDNGWQVHLVTALVPTAWARAVHGFDESLPGMEDTDFFHKLQEAGHCGRRVAECLLHYTENGKRSIAFRNAPDYLAVKEKIGRRYHRENMSCCGGQPVPNSGPFGERQPGDILARVSGPAFVRYVGRRSGRLYPPGIGHGALLWVDPADVEGDPARFQRVAQPVEPLPGGSPVLRSVAEIGEFMNAQRTDAYTNSASVDEPAPRRFTPTELSRLMGFEQ